MPFVYLQINTERVKMNFHAELLFTKLTSKFNNL